MQISKQRNDNVNIRFGLKLESGQVLVLGGEQFTNTKNGKTCYTVTVYDGYNCKKCFVRSDVFNTAYDCGTGIYTAVFDLNGNLRRLILEIGLSFDI